MHRYFPHTPHDIKLMLEKCGVDKLDDLYADVPQELRLKHPYNLPEEMSEMQVRRFLTISVPTMSSLFVLPEPDTTTITLRLSFLK